MKKSVRVMCLIMAIAMTLTSVISVFAAEETQKSVTAVVSTKSSTVKKVKAGSYKVNVKKIANNKKFSTQRQVQFKAPKSGTYRFMISNVSTSSLVYPIATFQLKNYTGKTPRVVKLSTGAGSFQKIKVYNKEYEEAYFDYLVGYKDDAGQDVDENECWETMITDMEERMSNGVCSEFFVDLELKKGEVIYVCSDCVGEYTYKGTIYQTRGAYKYDLTVKKV